MGNLSWFHEGRTHGAGRRAEDANLVNVFASYRHRGWLHMADGMEVASDIAFRSLPDLCQILACGACDLLRSSMVASRSIIKYGTWVVGLP